MELESILHHVLRLRGGKLPINVADSSNRNPEMGLSAGGKIQQYIQKDPHRSDSWNVERTIAFNVQIVDAAKFESLTGLRPPPCPIDADTYKANGLPFFDIPEAKSSIYGNFDKVEDHESILLRRQMEQWLRSNPKVRLNPDGPLRPFRGPRREC